MVLAAVVLCAPFCGSRSHRCDQHPEKVAPGYMSLRRWAASAFAVSVLLALCNLRNHPRPGWGNERQRVAQLPSQLVVFSENWHSDEWGRWRHLLGLAGIRLTNSAGIGVVNCEFNTLMWCESHPPNGGCRCGRSDQIVCAAKVPHCIEHTALVVHG